ncbi:ATP-binding SpoIIE family protein phosphatase [Brasilonema sp. UFV-L1]|uniref:ATP-binding SpoIIE family protein phosphatase n=1 Tax=Brasilonema sp. UFV-L1 TaxID=2234130 RepID=UPI00145C8258|nr:ATP-binding SpoIIE family protein phosphatase [Brasilonema sp. UFV-L1]NMG06022.1 serine/threonine protein kinase [Brasilonema sp. UFV-L1]
MKQTLALPMIEPSQAGEARRSAIALATSLGFNETERGKVGIVVTEIANNLVQHAKNGLVLLQAIEKHNIHGLEVLGLDTGPGISNISECLRDGFSTTTTPGNGLGAITRLSSLVDIYSIPDMGTVILSHLWASPIPESSSSKHLELGVVCLPKAGEEICGDAWAYEISQERCLILVADGLGHGSLAAQASTEAVRVFHEHIHHTPREIMEAAHKALRSTRGAAVGIAEINFADQSVRFAGVGNIAGIILCDTKRQNLVSYNGTVGCEVRKIQEFTHQWHPGGLLIMHSDGLGTQWRLERYPGLIHKHPSLIAGVLYRDFYRVRDDVTVLVMRESV